METTFRHNFRAAQILISLMLLFALATAAAVAAGDKRVTASAVLLRPGNHAYVATLVESCERGTAEIMVYLDLPYMLQGTQFLGIASQSSSTLAVFATSGGMNVSLQTFGGSSQIGCLAVGTSVSLVNSPGGMLSTMLTNMGQGVVTAATETR
jgi:hypothetical protein